MQKSLDFGTESFWRSQNILKSLKITDHKTETTDHKTETTDHKTKFFHRFKITLFS